MADQALPAEKIDVLRTAMETYFIDEKWTAALLIAAGAIAVIVGWMLFRHESAYRTAALPLVIIALIQIGVGAAIYQRTDAQLSGLWQQTTEDPAKFQADENTRMQKVLGTFKVAKIVELLLLFAGIGMCFAFREDMRLYGAGIGLIAQATLLLLIDLVAQKRADFYIAAIKDAFS